MTKDWCDNWTDEDLKALSEWDQKLIVAAKNGEPLISGITEDAKKPVLTPRLIVSLATGQHNQNWTLHPKGLMVKGFRFDKLLDFSNRHINTNFYLHNCLFQENCYFDNGCYRNLSFSHSTFQNPLFLRGAKIEDFLVLEGATLEGQDEIGVCLSAHSLTVGGSAFLRDNFKATGTINLLRAKIAGDLAMIGAELFTGSDEDNKNCLRADKISIGGSVYLRENFFCHGNLHFPVATIKGSFQILEAHFSGNLNLKNISIHQSFKFQKVTTEPTCTINLKHAYADVLNDDLDSWSGFEEIDLDGFEYNHLSREADGKQHLAWLHKMPEKYIPQPYEQLARNLKNDGHLGDARVVLIEKQKQLLEQGNITDLHRKWLQVIDFLIDFGYRPWKILKFIGLVILFGSFIFELSDEKGYFVPTKEKVVMEHEHRKLEAKKLEAKLGPLEYYRHSQKIGNKPPTSIKDWLPQYPEFNPIIYSIDAFFPFLDLKVENYWIPDANAQPVGWIARTYLWIHIVLGWFFSSLLIAGLAGLVKKDD